MYNLLVIWFLILPMNIMAQPGSSSEDSLLQVIRQGSKLEKVSALIKMAELYEKDSSGHANQYIAKALLLARELNNDTLEIQALNTRGDILYYQNKLDQSIQLYDEALVIAMKHSIDKDIGLLNHQKGYVYQVTNDFKNAAICYELALVAFKSTNDLKKVASTYNNLGIIWYKGAQFERAVEYFIRALETKETILPDGNTLGSKGEVAASLTNIGGLYWKLGNNTQALKYFERALGLNNELNNAKGILIVSSNLGVLHNTIHEYEKALYYYNLALGICDQLNDQKQKAVVLMGIGNVFKNKEDFKKALEYFIKAQTIGELQQDDNILSKIHKNIAGSYIGLNAFDKAEREFFIALGFAARLNNSDLIQEIYTSLSDNYAKTGDFQSAYLYALKSLQLTDSISQINNQTSLAEMQTRYETEKKEKEIILLSQENVINELNLNNQEITLKRQRNLIIAILLGILLFLLLAYLLFNRYKLRQEKLKMVLQMKNQEFEGRLLRSQMNPHFIFNSLASIQNFILKNDTSKAISYLLKFSGLIRNILNLSRKSFVSFEDDMATFRLQLELEKLRMKDTFDFTIEIDPTIEADKFYIPPMLLQPYIENAIKHGIATKKGDGLISIKISLAGDNLYCTVEDNGIGRRTAAELSINSQQNSVATQLTMERFEHLKKLGFMGISQKIIDLYDDENRGIGTRVELIIPFECE